MFITHLISEDGFDKSDYQANSRLKIRESAVKECLFGEPIPRMIFTPPNGKRRNLKKHSDDKSPA